jgi:hypothetical protein
MVDRVMFGRPAAMVCHCIPLVFLTEGTVYDVTNPAC